jgi:predicted permease
MRPADWLRDSGKDLEWAWRRARGKPAATASAVMCLAAGIATAVASASEIDRLFLRTPAGVQEGGRLVRPYVVERDGAAERILPTVSFPVYADLRATNAFSGVAAEVSDEIPIGTGPDAALVSAQFVSHTYFSVLRLALGAGRPFDAEDDRLPQGAPVVVVSAAWSRARFADGDAIGRPLTIAGRPYTVIGVAPVGFHGLAPQPADLWLPLGSLGAFRHPRWYEHPRTAMLRLVARLDDATTAETAGAMASSRLRHRSTEDARYPRVQRVDVAPLHEARGPLPSREAQVALWMGGVSILVFLIACANVAGLLAARAAARRDTVSLLLALGASRIRAARILASEPLVIAALAAALAVPLAASAARVLSWGTGGDMVVNPRLIAPLIGLLVVSILLCAILPVAQLWRTRAASLLKTAAVAGRAIPGEGPLLVAQVALTLTLLAGAGLFGRSLWQAHALDFGLALDDTLVIHLEEDPRPPEQEAAARLDRVRERLAALPGVEAVSTAAVPPIDFSYGQELRLEAGGAPIGPASGGPYINAVDEDFFRAAGNPIIAGRAFSSRDVSGSPRVAVVNESLARVAWPGTRAVGRCLYLGRAGDCIQVVGVSGDIRSRATLDPVAQVYVPFAQRPSYFRTRSLLVRTRVEPSTLIEPLRRAILEVAPAAPYVRIEGMRDLLAARFMAWTQGSRLFAWFAVVGLIASAVGTFGATLDIVTRRRSEIAVRMALGASRAAVLRLFLLHALRHGLAGLVLGTAGAALLGRYLQPHLFDTAGFDATTLSAAGLLLLAVVLAAAWIPASRASAASPAAAMRCE